MAHQRAWNFRYLALKLAAAAEEAVAQLQSSAAASLPEAVVKGMHAFRGQMTGVVVLTGAAMQPTLNSADGAPERLLARFIPRPVARRSVFDGDVVAFTSPIAGPASTPAVMVRRVAALEGDQLEAEEPGGEPTTFTIPEGHCWVLADNEALPPKDATDSRIFGPLPLGNILGRIMYSARSDTDHGPVENSEEGMAADAAVLEAELDLDRLCAVGAGTEASKESKH